MALMQSASRLSGELAVSRGVDGLSNALLRFEVKVVKLRKL